MDRLDSIELMIPSKVITDELCEDFGKFVGLMVEEPEMKHSNIGYLVSKLYGLSVESNRTNNSPLKYVFGDNRLLVNPDIDGDLNHAVVKETYAMFTDGSFKTPALAAISDGYRDNLAERLIGNQAQSDTVMDEKIIASLIERIMGSDKLAESHFKNKPETINSLLGNDLLSMIGDNYLNRQHRQQSRLGDIEKSLIDLFYQKENLTPEEIADFRLNLCGNSAYYEKNPMMYDSVNTVYEYFDSYQKNISL